MPRNQQSSQAQVDRDITEEQQRRQRQQLRKVSRQQRRGSISYETIANGTHNFVQTLFANHNMELVLREMINESGREREIGWLPTHVLTERQIIMVWRGTQGVKKQGSTEQATSHYCDSVKCVRTEYATEAKSQPGKQIFITNLAVSKTNGQNHYCAFWIDRQRGIVEVWDSATAGARSSPFTTLFKRAAELLFGSSGLDWITRVVACPGTPHRLAFQHGGGYFGRRGSLLSQNIFCHTWTLLYLELRLNGYSTKEIGCKRGSHPILPLLIIKAYAKCLLLRIGKGRRQSDYAGLDYVWDDLAQTAVVLPRLYQSPNQGKHTSSCAVRAIQTGVTSSYYKQPELCGGPKSNDKSGRYE